MAIISSYDIVLTFGKYKGKSLGYIYDIDPSYINWLAYSSNIPGNWSKACLMLLQNKDGLEELDLPRFKKTADFKQDAQMWMLNKNTIAVKFSYDVRLLERFRFEIDGRKWNAEEKYWQIPSAQILKLVELLGGTKNIKADSEVKKIYKIEKQRRVDLDEIRTKEIGNIKIPGKLELYNFQKVGVEFILRAGGRAMIADHPGLGKTLTSLGYAAYTKQKTLIICPKSVVIGWSREIERFTGKKATIWNSKDKTGRIDSQYHLINYEAVDKRSKELRSLGCGLLICDEATFIKNRTTKRTKSIIGDGRQTRKYPGLKTRDLILLTGTPVLNRPVEAFTLLNFIDSQRFNNFYQFIQKYGGWQGSDPRNLDDLHQRTKDCVIRRLRSEVWKELPIKQRNDLYVELSSPEKKEYKDLLYTLFRKWRSAGKPTIAEMPAIQNFLIEKKLPRFYEMVDELIEQDQSVLVYCNYIAPLKKIAKHYGNKAALLYGEMNMRERQESIDSLKSKEAKIGLFSIGAGAMGIDGLQYSINTVIFLDRAWVPALHEQSEDRCLRIGQTKQVSVYYMTCEGTIDEDMRSLLIEKQRIIDEIVDGKLITPMANKSIFKEFVQRLKLSMTAELESVDIDNID